VLLLSEARSEKTRRGWTTVLGAEEIVANL